MKLSKKVLLILSLLIGGENLFGSETQKGQLEISSDQVIMESFDTYNVFKFYNKVHMVGDDMDAFCDELEVIARKDGEGGVGVSNADNVEKIIARGNVIMEQEDRTIKAGRAEIFPGEGKLVLENNPEVISKDKGLVKGNRIVFYKDDKAYVEGGGEGQERPKVILSSLPDINQRKQKTALQKMDVTKEKR